MIGRLGSQQQIQQAQIQEVDSGVENTTKPEESPQQNETAKTPNYTATQTGDYLMSGQLSRLLLDRLLPPDTTTASGHVDPEHPVTPHDEPPGGHIDPEHIDPEHPVTPHEGPGPAPKANAGPNDVLKQGSSGPEVSKLQQELNTWRAQNGKEPIKVDGNFGPKTEAALKEFQSASGLKADGLGGPDTKAQLEVNSMPLDPEIKGLIQSDLKQYANNPAARENLMKEVRDPNFQALSKEGQQSALDWLRTKPSDATHAQNISAATKDMAKMESSAEFKKLDTNNQNLTRYEMFKFADTPAGTFNLTNLIGDPAFGKLQAEDQENVLKTINHNSPDQAVTLRAMMNSKSFEGMDDNMKGYVLILGDRNANDFDGTMGLIGLLNDPQFAMASKEEQWKQLKQFEKEPEPEIYR